MTSGTYTLWLILTLAILGGIAWAISEFGVAFAGGLFVGCVLTQVAARIKFGDWL